MDVWEGEQEMELENIWGRTGINWIWDGREWGRGITPCFRLHQLGRRKAIYRNTGYQARNSLLGEMKNSLRCCEGCSRRVHLASSLCSFQ